MRVSSIRDIDFTCIERCIMTILCIAFVIGLIIAIYCFVSIINLAYGGQLVETYYNQDYYD